MARAVVFRKPLSGANATVVLLGLTLAQCTWLGVSRADSSSDNVTYAKSEFARAIEAEDRGDWTFARTHLEHAANVRQTAGILYHLALCDEHLGRLIRARYGYQMAKLEAIEKGVQDVLQLVDERLANVDRSIPTVRIQLPAGIRAVVIRIDGARVEVNTNARYEVDPGNHTLSIEVQSPHEAAPIQFAIVAGQSLSLNVTILDRAWNKPEVGRDLGHRVLGDQRHRQKLRTAAILTTTGAVLFAGSGLLAFVMADRSHNDGRGECATRTSGSCDDLKSQVRALDGLALGAWIGATSLAAVTTVLWVDASQRPYAAMTLRPTGMTLHKSF